MYKIKHDFQIIRGFTGRLMCSGFTIRVTLADYQMGPRAHSKFFIFLQTFVFFLFLLASRICRPSCVRGTPVLTLTWNSSKKTFDKPGTVQGPPHGGGLRGDVIFSIWLQPPSFKIELALALAQLVPNS